MTPRLAIVIETLNYDRGNADLLAAVLGALASQTVPQEELEVLVVADPAVHPELRQWLAQQAPGVRLVDAPGAHYYAQKNRGAEAASAPVVGFIDADCVPLASWAECVLGYLSTDGEESVAAVQGVVFTDDTLQGQAFAATSFGQVQARTRQPATMLTGNNCAFRRDAFLAEPFDEAPQFHGPEVRKLARLQQAGRQVVLEPGAAVRHAFYPGVGHFIDFSMYWGWCFLHLRRAAMAAGEPVPYRWWHRLGLAGPLLLIPAKMVMDWRRLLEHRRAMGLSWGRVGACALFLAAMAPAVCYGALLERLGREPPTPLY
ncbi:MAG: glycosyltransferase family 2 protein [Pseudohaliea sp.]